MSLIPLTFVGVGNILLDGRELGFPLRLAIESEGLLLFVDSKERRDKVLGDGAIQDVCVSEARCFLRFHLEIFACDLPVPKVASGEVWLYIAVRAILGWIE